MALVAWVEIADRIIGPFAGPLKLTETLVDVNMKRVNLGNSSGYRSIILPSSIEARLTQPLVKQVNDDVVHGGGEIGHEPSMSSTTAPARSEHGVLKSILQD